MMKRATAAVAVATRPDVDVCENNDVTYRLLTSSSAAETRQSAVQSIWCRSCSPLYALIF